MSTQIQSIITVADVVKRYPALRDLLILGIQRNAFSKTEVAHFTGIHKSTIGRWVQKGTYVEDDIQTPQRG